MKEGDNLESIKSEWQVQPRKTGSKCTDPVAGGSIVGYFAIRNSQEVYRMLEKPDFSPPTWVFPSVWTSLYALMRVASYRISMKAEIDKTAKDSLIPYGVQLGLNFLWSFLFF
ncbi:TspO/MBR family protein [Mesobacillus zeae]|uniref:TspO/MBR family protein n=1 Tax=Mesobacillus zeae TaxID=1917180 RepID=UPI0021756899|nr:TspO/MBR family protein [Mesobacillus zeae]